MELIDTHAHLDFPHYDRDRREVIKRAREGGIQYIVNVGADIESSKRSLALSKDYPFIYATVGVHPHDANEINEKALSLLEDMAGGEKVVAIGEIGLDFYYDNSPRDIQRKAFRLQLNLARKLKLPVVIHSREAAEETLRILKEEKVEDIGGIFHCFSEDMDTAREIMDMGMFIAIGGVITFSNAKNLRKVVSGLPLTRLVIETDAPYLTPHPHRGHRNEPAYVKYVAEEIAKAKKISPAEVAAKTTENAREVYNIP